MRFVPDPRRSEHAPPMLASLLVAPGSAAGLERRDSRDTLGLAGKDAAAAELDALLEELSSLQERL